MSLEIYCKPSSFFKNSLKKEQGMLLSLVTNYKSEADLEDKKIAILGVNEDRAAVTNECLGGADKVREELYKLSALEFSKPIIDIGNIHPGNTLQDTYFAVQTVIEQLLKLNIVTIVIGGSQDLTYAQFLAYQNLEQTINVVSVDSRFDLGDSDSQISSQSYLSKIILHEPNFLFNYSHLAYQTYFVKQQEIDIMSKLHFETYRLGEIRTNIAECEPVVRNADFLSFDISSIKQSDAPANKNASSNGLLSDEACAICRYAGLSDQLSSIGFYEFNPILDQNNLTAKQLSQMVWYFIEGVNNRKNEQPGENDNYFKYRVNDIEDKIDELVFYKSKKSDRWWIEVSVPNRKSKFERHYLIPCSYKDYQDTCKKELPNRWWKTYQKLI